MTNGNAKFQALQMRRAELIARRQKYLDMESDILSGADRTNTIGSRRIERYDINLDDLRKAIKDLDDELAAIDAELASGSSRKTFAVIPRDW